MSGKKDKKEKEYVKTYKGPGPLPPVGEDDIERWLEGLAKNNQVEIFSMEIDKTMILLDDEDARIVMTKKGATLKHIEEFKKGMQREKYLLIKDVKKGTKYISDMHLNEGMTFKKITGDLDLRKIKEFHAYYSCSLELPEEVVIVEKLRIAFDYEDNEISLWRNKCLIDDELFKRIQDFIEDKAKQIGPLHITETEVTV